MLFIDVIAAALFEWGGIQTQNNRQPTTHVVVCQYTTMADWPATHHYKNEIQHVVCSCGFILHNHFCSKFNIIWSN
jgi:hypothetical protein